MGATAHELHRTFDALVRYVLAAGAAFLPRRLWPEWEGRLPIGRMAVPAALLTFFLGFAVGIPGFLQYAVGTASVVTDTMLQTAHDENKGRAAPGATVRAWGISFFSLLAFALFTPTGLVATYLVATGVLRGVSAAAGDPRGDPLLALVDSAWRRSQFELARDRMVAERERLEGPVVPDVLLEGSDMGVPGADFVLVASRRKRGWEPGVVVVTSEKWYRVGAPFDRRLAGGLRSVYPLTELAAAEVLRRSVAYELPRLSRFDSVTRTTKLAEEPHG